MKARSAIKRMKKVVTGVAWYTGVPWSKYTYELRMVLLSSY